MATPKTLLEAVRHFSDPDVALNFTAALRWPNGEPTCPKCGHKRTSFISTRRVWKCKGCRSQFSVKVGTIFEDSPLPLTKWLPAIWVIANCKNGVSSYELARTLGVTQKTAWFMLHRIRLAMQTKSFQKMKGVVEVDETFIGGRARYMHKDKRKSKIAGRGPVGKAVVMGLLERHGQDGTNRVAAKVIPNRRRKHVEAAIKDRVEPESTIYSDELPSYERLFYTYGHEVINHAETYVRGNVHTNGMENFWSLLKRAIKGTYVSVEPFHLFRYLDEQSYRYNARKKDDSERFVNVLRSIADRRLTYSHLTGRHLPATI